jgi:hypothetical protein
MNGTNAYQSNGISRSITPVRRRPRGFRACVWYCGTSVSNGGIQGLGSSVQMVGYVRRNNRLRTVNGVRSHEHLRCIRVRSVRGVSRFIHSCDDCLHSSVVNEIDGRRPLLHGNSRLDIIDSEARAIRD